MGQLRVALSGALRQGHSPASALEILDAHVSWIPGSRASTAACLLLDRASGTLRWARAGHLPPVLVRGRTACELPLPGGVLLGMDPDATYEEATQSMEPGDTLLLFTDGLIEQRGESIVDVLREFVATVAPVPAGQEGSQPTAAAQADRILATAVSDTDDDACLVAVRIR